jgi:hypothetical protein
MSAKQAFDILMAQAMGSAPPEEPKKGRKK